MKLKKIILLLISVLSLSGYSPIQLESEYYLKAAFIYRFIDYIEWPENQNETYFNIAILGDSPITTPLNEIADSKLAKNKRISVKEYQNLNAIGSPQILFISRNSSYAIEDILSRMGERSVLIITERAGYAQKGAHINFLSTENKLKFEVNLKVVNRTGLKFSSQLLRHAIIIN